MMVLLIISGIVLFILGALLVFLVFLQNPKDQGGMSTLGTGMQQMIGFAQASNVLEKATYVLACLIFALTLFMSFHIHQHTDKTTESSAILSQLEKYAEEKPVKKS